MIIDFFARDVTLLGLTSPLLSWLGSAGLLGFFTWQTWKLRADVARAITPFLRVRPVLQSLVKDVEGADLRQAYERAFSDGRHARRAGAAPPPGATDLTRLKKLDQAMRELVAFKRPWIQYRKTLLIEHVSWTTEPRIFSTRQAEEYFGQEAALGHAIDLGFYNQVPSLITGLGLLLTFVAICIGLTRLHADGQTISGIQGLINGLAGKFLTSIVGLTCANLFVLVERPALNRLRTTHVEFLALLDESFPRRTVEDLLDALRQEQSRARWARDDRGEAAERVAQEVEERINQPITELTAMVRSLAERVFDPRGARAAAYREPAHPVGSRLA